MSLPLPVILSTAKDLGKRDPSPSARLRMTKLALVVVAACAACRRSVPPLDDVQRMAYGIKPGVVRINAYATAKFVYRPEAIARVVGELRRNGVTVTTLMPSSTEPLPTGAGGSGSGFIVHPDGLI